MIEIMVNGKEWKVDSETVVADLLSRFKIPSKVCVVERNGEVLERNSYHKISFSSGDKIEIIRMMGGG